VIDIHSHLLPGVDDGSRSLAQSVAVLKELAQAGITDIVVTPHLRAGDIPGKGEEAIRVRDERLAELKTAAPAEVRLHAGFEIMLDGPLPRAVLGDRRYALAGSRYYLVEFPLSVMGHLVADVLQAISAKGLVPIVAHPERYHLCTVRTVDLWRTVGAAIQLDATAITRPTSRGELARRLLRAGLADVLAADNHGDRRSLATGRRFLEEHGAADAAAWLTVENPRAVINDGRLVPVPKAKLRVGLAERMRNWMQVARETGKGKREP
jgi:protein-tyrosine phosphatase